MSRRQHEQDPPQGAGPSAANVAALRVLVVDDNADSADSLAMLLEIWGHRPRVARNGEEALAAMRAEPTDLVLLDIGLPGIDGYEIARRVRSEHAAPPRMIAISGYTRAEDKARARAAGFDEHLAKPVDLEHLRTMLAAVR